LMGPRCEISVSRTASIREPAEDVAERPGHFLATRHGEGQAVGDSDAGIRVLTHNHDACVCAPGQLKCANDAIRTRPYFAPRALFIEEPLQTVSIDGVELPIERRTPVGSAETQQGVVVVSHAAFIMAALARLFTFRPICFLERNPCCSDPRACRSGR
jgi:hypothetical protein